MSASETVSQRPTYEPFGAFRLLLAVFVITGHLFLLGPESDAVKALGLDDTGVALFFIISGYIIFQPMSIFIVAGRSNSPSTDYCGFIQYSGSYLFLRSST